MKTRLNLNSIAFLLMAILLMGCSTSDDSDGNNNNNNNQDNSAEIMQIENEAQSGTWIITLYIDSGEDETNDYNGYNFTFSSNGTLSADNGNMTINGSWSVTDSSDSSDDSSNDDDIDFNIVFSSPPDFAELTDDWDVVQHSSTRLELIDISGGNGDTDNLVFERN